jgi:hypothetical protein
MIYSISGSNSSYDPQEDFPSGILESETVGYYLIPLSTSLTLVEGVYTSFIIA